MNPTPLEMGLHNSVPPASDVASTLGQSRSILLGKTVSHLFLRRHVLTALLDPFGERETGLARYVRPRLAGWGEAASEDAHPIPNAGTPFKLNHLAKRQSKPQENVQTAPK